MTPPLKLKASDADDICVISAMLQDAIVPVEDMVWQKIERQFIMVPQRLCRETNEGAKPDRVCCAITVRGVESAQTHDLDLADRERMLELLMVALDGSMLHLVFAGGAEIRLKLNDWMLTAEDFGESWPCGRIPCHDRPPGAPT